VAGPPRFGKEIYKNLNTVERTINRLRGYRAVRATAASSDRDIDDYRVERQQIVSLSGRGDPGYRTASRDRRGYGSWWSHRPGYHPNLRDPEPILDHRDPCHPGART
jgi:hypothetical protein